MTEQVDGRGTWRRAGRRGGRAIADTRETRLTAHRPEPERKTGSPVTRRRGIGCGYDIWGRTHGRRIGWYRAPENTAQASGTHRTQLTAHRTTRRQSTRQGRHMTHRTRQRTDVHSYHGKYASTPLTGARGAQRVLVFSSRLPTRSTIDPTATHTRDSVPYATHTQLWAGRTSTRTSRSEFSGSHHRHSSARQLTNAQHGERTHPHCNIRMCPSGSSRHRFQLSLAVRRPRKRTSICAACAHPSCARTPPTPSTTNSVP